MSQDYNKVKYKEMFTLTEVLFCEIIDQKSILLFAN